MQNAHKKNRNATLVRSCEIKKRMEERKSQERTGHRELAQQVRVERVSKAKRGEHCRQPSVALLHVPPQRRQVPARRLNVGFAVRQQHDGRVAAHEVERRNGRTAGASAIAIARAAAGDRVRLLFGGLEHLQRLEQTVPQIRAAGGDHRVDQREGARAPGGIHHGEVAHDLGRVGVGDERDAIVLAGRVQHGANRVLDNVECGEQRVFGALRDSLCG